MTTDGPSTSYITDIPVVIPASIDYVIVYSTLYGCASFRDPTKGSIFIQIVKKADKHFTNSTLCTAVLMTTSNFSI